MNWIKIRNFGIKLDEVFMFEVNSKDKTISVFFNNGNIKKTIIKVTREEIKLVKKLIGSK